jgi:hypothetical protein
MPSKAEVPSPRPQQPPAAAIAKAETNDKDAKIAAARTSKFHYALPRLPEHIQKLYLTICNSKVLNKNKMKQVVQQAYFEGGDQNIRRGCGCDAISDMVLCTIVA